MSSFLRFIDHTQWHVALDRNPLDEWSARRKDLYLTTHSTRNRHSRPPCGIRTRSPSKLEVSDLHLRWRSHRVRRLKYTSLN
jgi:hypothetical protein